MQRENSPNEVQKRYSRGRNFFGIQTVSNGVLYPQKWATVGNPVNRSMDSIYPNRVTHVMQQVHHLNENDGKEFERKNVIVDGTF